MESSVKERLVKYLKYKGIGQNKFERDAGISNGYIANLKANPGTTILNKICTAAPDLDKTWLLTGQGSMIGDGRNLTTVIMEGDVLQRLIEFIKDKSISEREFAISINVAQTTLNNYMNKKRKLSLSVICKVLEKYPELSAEWLLRGVEVNPNEDYIYLRDAYNRILGENTILREQIGLSPRKVAEKIA